MLEPKTDKKSIAFFEEAPGLVSIRLIRPVLTTYASKPIKVYLIKSYITQTMFCIASSRPSLIPPIITALDHAHIIIIIIIIITRLMTHVKVIHRVKNRKCGRPRISEGKLGCKVQSLPIV